MWSSIGARSAALLFVIFLIGIKKVKTSVLSRRGFLTSTSATALLGASVFAGPAGFIIPFAAAVEDQTAAQLIAGKDQRLIVLKDRPAVIETPLEFLLKPGPTPADLLFVRNNQQPENAATMQPLPLAGWKIELSGLINRNLVIDATELTDMDQVEHEMVLQCSGNGRSLFSRSAQTKGTQWGRGGIGCVRFGGVKLSTLLEKKGIEPKPAARFITAEGADNPSGDDEDFEHSLPLDDVLNRSLIALTLNGKPLPAIHGGPVRLVTPGVYGTMQMKWLSRLRFETSETTNHNHAVRYRVPRKPIKPGSEYKFTFDNSDFNWNMKIKTVLLSPAPAATVPAGELVIEGVAFNDGQAAIETVLVSLDKGQSWQLARLEVPDSKYSWTRFRHQVSLNNGPHSVWTRAIDQWGRSQPLDGSIAWNPSGYEWNGVEQIDLVVA